MEKNILSLLILNGFFLSLCAAAPLNILLVTVDDMNIDSPGFMGSPVPDLTPELDRLSKDSVIFTNAFVPTAICYPSRASMMTGLYPVQHGCVANVGIREGTDNLVVLFQQAGYYTGLAGKDHISPRSAYPWDDVIMEVEKGKVRRHPQRYGTATRQLMSKAHDAGKPFFLTVNISDPHRPLIGDEGENAPPAPRRYTPKEVPVPEFLPDIPEIRQDIANYYSSVHRADACVGAILAAVRESGSEESTLVVFLSDHGMSFPFAKHDTYPASLRVPFLMRWPGVLPSEHSEPRMISSLDIAPTLLRAAGMEVPPSITGLDLVSLVQDPHQPGRDAVFGSYHFHSLKTDSGRILEPYPQRAILTEQGLYIVNLWSDGQTSLAPAQGRRRTSTSLATSTDQKAKARWHFYLTRTPEEFYDLTKDPWALENRILDPTYTDQVVMLRQRLLDHLEEVQDPAWDAARTRTISSRNAFLKKQRELGRKKTRQRSLLH